MSSTNKTTNYNLSQFVGTDVPSYLGDYNGDMSKIDKAIGDVANSQGSVEQSVVGLTAEVQGLSTQVSGVSTSVQQVQTSVAQIDTAYKQADTALSQRITANANNIQTNTTAIESANTAIGNINTAIGTTDISEIGDGTIKGAISNINSSLSALPSIETCGTWNQLGVSTEHTATSEWEVVNLSDSLNNYKSIGILVTNSNGLSIYSTFELPIAILKNITTDNYATNMGISYGAQIRYKDDSSIYIKDIRNSVDLNAPCKIKVYGIK